MSLTSASRSANRFARSRPRFSKNASATTSNRRISRRRCSWSIRSTPNAALRFPPRKDAQDSSITGELIGPLESVRRRNVRFVKAQVLLLEELRSLGRRKRSLDSRLREARRQRDKALVAEITSKLKIENIKDVVGRKLAD